MAYDLHHRWENLRDPAYTAARDSVGSLGENGFTPTPTIRSFVQSNLHTLAKEGLELSSSELRGQSQEALEQRIYEAMGQYPVEYLESFDRLAKGEAPLAYISCADQVFEGGVELVDEIEDPLALFCALLQETDLSFSAEEAAKNFHVKDLQSAGAFAKAHLQMSSERSASLDAYLSMAHERELDQEIRDAERNAEIDAERRWQKLYEGGAQYRTFDGSVKEQLKAFDATLRAGAREAKADFKSSMKQMKLAVKHAETKEQRTALKAEMKQMQAENKAITALQKKASKAERAVLRATAEQREGTFRTKNNARFQKDVAMAGRLSQELYLAADRAVSSRAQRIQAGSFPPEATMYLDQHNRSLAKHSATPFARAAHAKLSAEHETFQKQNAESYRRALSQEAKDRLHEREATARKERDAKTRDALRKIMPEENQRAEAKNERTPLSK